MLFIMGSSPASSAHKNQFRSYHNIIDHISTILWAQPHNNKLCRQQHPARTIKPSDSIVAIAEGNYGVQFSWMERQWVRIWYCFVDFVFSATNKNYRDTQRVPLRFCFTVALSSSFLSIFCFSLFFWNAEPICVITSDGRIILGDLIGHDQVQNLILNDAKERVYSNGSSPEEVDLGLYVIRGDNVCMVADYNPDLWTDDSVAPLAPIRQQEKI